MKTIFDKETRAELISRINSLDENCKAQWGKMNVYQMAKHCTIWDDWVLGKTNVTYKQGFLGLIFGRMALKPMVKDDRPIKKNMPSGRAFIVKDNDGNIEHQKKIWTERIAAYEHFSNPRFIHDFFGKMTVDEIGIFAYKHADHHLRQFNA
ncbi:DUF1569 domain-containing protein [Terrimonas pollutisoli]|uniref:DUF1569 domain-containing protein n=1 Tax=Terrimonas pollutisoli TaxID=3034147 RepID=UPI0023EAB942|nr:DUF1569 domain-containing protein [Terrimonas sp. H1YJ31]